MTTVVLLKGSSIVLGITPACIASTLMEGIGMSHCSSQRVIGAGLVSDCDRLLSFKEGGLPSGFFLRSAMGGDLEGAVMQRVIDGALVRHRFADDCATGFMVRGGQVCMRGTGHTARRNFVAMSGLRPGPGGPIVTTFFEGVNCTSRLKSKMEGLFGCDGCCSKGSPRFMRSSVFQVVMPLSSRCSFSCDARGEGGAMDRRGGTSGVPVDTSGVPVDTSGIPVGSLSIRRESVVRFMREGKRVASQRIRRLLRMGRQQTENVLKRLIGVKLLRQRNSCGDAMCILGGKEWGRVSRFDGIRRGAARSGQRRVGRGLHRCCSNHVIQGSLAGSVHRKTGIPICMLRCLLKRCYGSSSSRVVRRNMRGMGHVLESGCIHPSRTRGVLSLLHRENDCAIVSHVAIMLGAGRSHCRTAFSGLNMGKVPVRPSCMGSCSHLLYNNV